MLACPSPHKRPPVTAFEPGQVIRKTRRATDDFELSRELGPQGLTMDSVLDDRLSNLVNDNEILKWDSHCRAAAPVRRLQRPKYCFVPASLYCFAASAVLELLFCVSSQPPPCLLVLLCRICSLSVTFFALLSLDYFLALGIDRPK